MSDSVLSIAYGAGLAQAVFLVCALSALNVRNRVARWHLVALVVVFSVLLAEEFFDSIGHSLRAGLGLAVEFAMAPLLYLFVSALVASEPWPVRKSLRHFVPLATASLVLIGLHLGLSGEVSLSNPNMASIIAVVVLVKSVYFFSYAAATLRQPPPAEVSDRRRNAIDGLRKLIALAVVLYAVQAMSFVAFLLHVPSIPDSDEVGALLLAAALYAIGYFALVNRQVFDLRDPYEAAPLPADEAASIRARALQHLVATEAFLDPELALQALARALSMPAAKLSQALNMGEGGGFSGLVNGCRLRAFLAARANGDNNAKTALDLAFEAGFNSKATFYRVLKAAGAHGAEASDAGGAPIVAIKGKEK